MVDSGSREGDEKDTSGSPLKSNPQHCCLPSLAPASLWHPMLDRLDVLRAGDKVAGAAKGLGQLGAVEWGASVLDAASWG